VPLVVFGHMHRQLQRGGQRAATAVGKHGEVYVNAAMVRYLHIYTYVHTCVCVCVCVCVYTYIYIQMYICIVGESGQRQQSGSMQKSM